MIPNFLIERLFWSAKIAKILQIKSLFRSMVAHQKIEMNGIIDKICHVVVVFS